MSNREAFQSQLETLCQNEDWGVAPDRVDVTFDNGRRQCIHIEEVDFEGEELVRFFSVIGDSQRIDAMRLTQALRISFGLAHGALAIRADDLVIVDTLRVDDADADETRAVLRYLAETADHLESTMFGVDEH